MLVELHSLYSHTDIVRPLVNCKCFTIGQIDISKYVFYLLLGNEHKSPAMLSFSFDLLKKTWTPKTKLRSINVLVLFRMSTVPKLYMSELDKTWDRKKNILYQMTMIFCVYNLQTCLNMGRRLCLVSGWVVSATTLKPLV